MSKPVYFRKIKYPISCENCRYTKRDWKKMEAVCKKHDFQIATIMTSSELDKYTCDDALPHLGE